MPGDVMQAGKAGRKCKKTDDQHHAPQATGVWLTPRPPDTGKKSRSHSQKCPPGECPGVPQPPRHLPRFNAAKLNNRFRESLYIGVRSPYALVNRYMEHKKSRQYRWDRMTAKECNDRLVQHLGISVNGDALGYEQLFDPKHGSRLFARSMKQTLQQIQQGIPPGDCTHGVQTGAAYPIKACTNAKQWIEPDTKLPWIYNKDAVADPNPSFDAPRQGTADDCWFIAALSSIAFVFPDMLKSTNRTGIFILDPASRLTGQDLLNASWIKPDDTLPYSATATDDSSQFWWSKSKYAERWVAMMEKAFAMRMLKVSGAPNVCNIPKGDPQYALYVLMGDEKWQRFWNITKDAQAPAWQDETGKSTYTMGSLFDMLWENCSSYTNSLFRMTKRPSVAFTFNSSDDAPSPRNYVDPNPYSTDLLVASHSYSLLGVYNEGGKLVDDKPSGGTNYVVLMNPWGIISGVTFGTRDAIPGLSKGSLAKGPLPGFSDQGTKNRNLWTQPADLNDGRPKDGVFALDLNTFARYFRGFSWA
jgi:hypothetical protein